MSLTQTLLATALLALRPASAAQQFTIHNGQIFTPGFAVLNAPQPETPLGGDTLHVSLDVTANGKLPLATFDEDAPSQIYNITMFLYSYDTNRNFTITNGTASANNASHGDIMLQEPGSTVKHVNWVWPDCLVGDGKPDNEDSDRGIYNISIRQNFRLNDEDHYTIFDVPIAVTNSIQGKDRRPSCDELDNEMWTPEEVDIEAANDVDPLFAPGDATKVNKGDFKEDNDHDGKKHDDVEDDNGGGFGGDRDRAGPEDGLGNSASNRGHNWMALAVVFLLCSSGLFS